MYVVQGLYLGVAVSNMDSAIKVVECVPNFSEGRKDATIQAIASAIRGTENCSLQDVEPTASANRTVYTFFGPPRGVVEGALNAARVARKLIDMTKHQGFTLI